MTACARCASAIEPGDLRCPICAQVVPAAAAPVAAPTAAILRCAGCAAALAFDPEAGAPRCGFCGEVVAVEQPADPIEAAIARVPLVVDRAAAEAALRAWLASRGWLAPRDLARAATAQLAPIAWAAWRVDAIAQVTWAADSDAGAERAAWAPHAGEAELEFRDVLVSASRGLSEAEARRLTPYYALDRAVAIDAPAAADEHPAPVEQFDAQRAAARRYVHERITAAARVRIERRIPGRRFRNVHVACLLTRQRTDRLALPAWVAAYHYRGRRYRAIVHGQRPELVLGDAPVDRRKLAGVAAIVVAIVVAVAWLARLG